MPTPPPEYTTLAQLLVVNDKSLVDLNVADIILAGTMLGILHAQESSNGTKHSYYKTTQAPVVGFRVPGASANNKPGVKTAVNLDLNYLDATATEDRAIADPYKNGPEAFMGKRAMENLAAAVHMAETQFIYGTTAEADGFVGLVEDANLDALADAMVVGAGGTGSDVESAWIIRTSEDDMSVIYNDNDGEPLEIGEVTEQMLNAYDSTGAVTGQFSGYAVNIATWLGLQFGSKYSIARVANIDVTAADAEEYIEDGLSLFPADRPATHIVCSRRVRRAIQRGRTGFSTSGRAPTPTEVDDYPLVISEALVGETAIT